MSFLRALLLAVALTEAVAQISACGFLDGDGCCGLACQTVICQLLYSSGELLGGAASDLWTNRTGWERLYDYPGPPDAACGQYLSGSAAATPPLYCSWHGIMCNSAAYRSTCSQSSGAYGISNITLANNNLSGQLNNEFAVSMKQLHDCGLETLILGGASFNLLGTISPFFGQLTHLKTLRIFGTSLTGIIPAELGNMTALEILDLNTNHLVGTIPAELGQLRSLQRLNLGYNGWSDENQDLTGTFPSEWLNLENIQILMVDHNGLYGTLPGNLCQKLTKLSAVSFSNNQFDGPAVQFGNCFSLTALDLSNNNFTGPFPLPNGTAWTGLQNLRMNNNNFSGPLPSFAIGQAPQLSFMYIGNNSLTGTIPVSWTYLPFLTVVEASFNYITGDVPWQLAFQSRLYVLALDNNPDLTGTIDARWRFSVGLKSLRLHNTDVTGPLPGISRRGYANMADPQRLCGSDGSGLGRLPLLQEVSIHNTNMTARCTADPQGTCTDIQDALPWYLNLDYTAWQIPLPEYGFASNENMQCPTVIQEQYCYRGTPIYFGNDTRPDWDVSPSYYHYLGCQCQAGFAEHHVKVWHDDVLVSELRCEKALTPAEIAGISVSVSAVGLVLLAYLAYVSWYGRFGLPRLRRAYADVKKRLVGAPTSGKISVVVTDIESYSALIVAMPLVMGKAMSQHNNAVRKAAWTHFGSIIGQEGDSYILAFSDALDAVAFCLQFQQALKKIDWPLELLQYLQQQEAAALGLTALPGISAPPIRSTHGLGKFITDTTRLRDIAAASIGVGASTSDGAGTSGASGDEFHAVAEGASRESSRFWSIISRTQRSSNSGSVAGARVSPSVPSFDAPSCQPRRPYSPPTAQGTDIPASASHEALPSMEQQRSQQQQPRLATVTALVPGLRVRMGIASGVLCEKEHDILTCRVLEVARLVSDAAVGGQVLIDSNTFKAVKDRLEELGQVGPSGYSRSNRVTGWGTPRGWLAKLVARHSRSLTAEAQVLDMGMYTIPGFKLSTARDAAAVLPELPCLCQLAVDATAKQQAASVSNKDPAAISTLQPDKPAVPVAGGLTAAVSLATAADRGVASQCQQTPGGNTAAADAATVEASPLPPVGPSVTLQQVPSAGAAASPGSCLRLYQVLAPRLVDRAHLFGNRLSLKDGFRCHDLPYFCAPAAANRPTLDADLQQPMLVSEARRLTNSGSSTALQNGRKPASVFNAASAASAPGQAASWTGYLSILWQGRSQRGQQQQQQASLLGPQLSMRSQRRCSGGDGDGSLAPLPVLTPARPVTLDDAVTFVFCSVVIPRVKLSMDTNPKLTAQVSSIVGKVIRECIMAFARTPVGSSSSCGQQAGGYLCRDMGGDMKYMLAFQNPRVALEWCLLVQEVLLWQDWPASLLDKPAKSNEVSHQPPQVLGRRASMVVPTSAAAAAAAAYLGQPLWGLGNGVTQASLAVPAHSHRRGPQALFRGPRLKMGVCSGSPQTVTPDHQGRADYHGNAVNMAARFEAICAQGGQIVCEASLAEAVVAEWAATQAAAAAAVAVSQVFNSTPGGAVAALVAGPEMQPQQQSVQQQGRQPASAPAELPVGQVALGSVSPFQAASHDHVQQHQPAAVQVSPAAAAAAPTMDSLGGGASFPGPWSVGSSPVAAGDATSSLTAPPSIPTAGESLRKLVEDSDAAAIADSVVSEANATVIAAAQAAIAATQSPPLAIPGRSATPTPSDMTSGTITNPGALPGSLWEAAAAVRPPLAFRTAAAPAANGPQATASSLPSAALAVSGDSIAGLGMSAGTAGTSGGLLAGFVSAAASNLQSKGGVGVPRRSGRSSKASARPGALVLAPAPTELPCPSHVPEVPPESFGVEVYQVGKFVVKGHTGPVEIVEVLLSHLSARRQLLGDNIPKAQKGQRIEVQTAKVAAVEAVQLPGVARLYRQQHEQQMAVTRADVADPTAVFAAQPQALSARTDSLSFSGIQQLSLQQQSLVHRTSTLFTSLMSGTRRQSSVGTNSAHSLSIAGSVDSLPTFSAVQSSRRPSQQASQQPWQQSTTSLPPLQQAPAGGVVEGGVAVGVPVSYCPADTHVTTGAGDGSTLELPVIRRQFQAGVVAADDAV